MQVFAGTGAAGDGGEGGPAALAQLDTPNAVALDGRGRLYVSGRYKIWRIELDGTITTVAGAPDGEVGEGIPALKAFLRPGPLVVTEGGDIYHIQRSAQTRIMFIDASTAMVTTFAGTGSAGNSGDTGPALHAQFGSIAGIAFGPNGDLYLADQRYNVIRVVSHEPDHTVSTVAGTGTPGYDGDGGPARKAQLNSPSAVAVDKAGNLYIADTENKVIRLVSRDGIIRTIAGTGRADATSDGTPLGTSIGYPQSLIFDSDGRLYLVDPVNLRILRLQHG